MALHLLPRTTDDGSDHRERLQSGRSIRGAHPHADAFTAGELKHDPLALVDRDMSVIAIAPNDALIEELTNNIQEVGARCGQLNVITDADAGTEMAAGGKDLTRVVMAEGGHERPEC